MASIRLAFVFLAISAITCVSESTTSAADPKPDRAAFLGEVLDAKPTSVTSKFDDYTRGSYHIDKIDLLMGLIGEAARRKLVLHAVLVSGPMPDPLWTYYVTVFLKDGDQVRVNHLVMPHARITAKSTGLISTDDFQKALSALLDSGLPKKVAPIPADGKEKELRIDRDNQLLLGAWNGEGKLLQLYSANLLKDEKKVSVFAEAYNGLLKGLKKTYPESD